MDAWLAILRISYSNNKKKKELPLSISKLMSVNYLFLIISWCIKTIFRQIDYSILQLPITLNHSTVTIRIPDTRWPDTRIPDTRILDTWLPEAFIHHIILSPRIDWPFFIWIPGFQFDIQANPIPERRNKLFGIWITIGQKLTFLSGINDARSIKFILNVDFFPIRLTSTIHL